MQRKVNSAMHEGWLEIGILSVMVLALWIAILFGAISTKPHDVETVPVTHDTTTGEPSIAASSQLQADERPHREAGPEDGSPVGVTTALVPPPPASVPPAVAEEVAPVAPTTAESSPAPALIDIPAQEASAPDGSAVVAVPTLHRHHGKSHHYHHRHRHHRHVHGLPTVVREHDFASEFFKASARAAGLIP